MNVERESIFKILWSQSEIAIPDTIIFCDQETKKINGN